MRASSASELAPQPVSAGSGALNVKSCGLWWNNGNFHRGTLSSEADDNHNSHCFAPFSCRSALQPLSGSYLGPKRSFALPLVVNLSIVHASFHFSALCQSLQEREYRSKGVRVLGQVIARLH